MFHHCTTIVACNMRLMRLLLDEIRLPLFLVSCVMYYNYSFYHVQFPTILLNYHHCFEFYCCFSYIFVHQLSVAVLDVTCILNSSFCQLCSVFFSVLAWPYAILSFIFACLVVLFCLISSCLVLSSHLVPSCPFSSGLVLSYLVLSCPLLYSVVPYFHVMSHHVSSYLIPPCPTLARLGPSCPVLSCPVSSRTSRPVSSCLPSLAIYLAV